MFHRYKHKVAALGCKSEFVSLLPEKKLIEVNPYDTAFYPGGTVPMGGGWDQIWSADGWEWVDFTGKDQRAGAQPMWFAELEDFNKEAARMREWFLSTYGARHRQVTAAGLRARITASALPFGWVKEHHVRMIGECVWIALGSVAGEQAMVPGRGEVIRVAIVAAIIAGYVSERGLVERVASLASDVGKNSGHVAKRIAVEVDKWPLGRGLIGHLREDIEAGILLIYEKSLHRIATKGSCFFQNFLQFEPAVLWG